MKPEGKQFALWTELHIWLPLFTKHECFCSLNKKQTTKNNKKLQRQQAHVTQVQAQWCKVLLTDWYVLLSTIYEVPIEVKSFLFSNVLRLEPNTHNAALLSSRSSIIYSPTLFKTPPTLDSVFFLGWLGWTQKVISGDVYWTQTAEDKAEPFIKD